MLPLLVPVPPPLSVKDEPFLPNKGIEATGIDTLSYSSLCLTSVDTCVEELPEIEILVSTVFSGVSLLSSKNSSYSFLAIYAAFALLSKLFSLDE